MLVAEVAPEQTELPQMVGDIFADVSHRAIRAHNHFGVFVRTFFVLASMASGASCLSSGCFFLVPPSSPLHYPAAFVLAFSLKVEHALLL